MVGDRILTDVVFGRRHGMFCILSAPLTPSKDSLTVRASRLIENRLAPAVSRFPLEWLRSFVGHPSPTEREKKSADVMDRDDFTPHQMLDNPWLALHSEKT